MGIRRKNHKLKAKGIDVEFSQELADQDDLKAQTRALAAKHRVKQNKNKS
nr:YfhD family protein [uncultured Bacillus sp.]